MEKSPFVFGVLVVSSSRPLLGEEHAHCLAYATACGRRCSLPPTDAVAGRTNPLQSRASDDAIL